MEPDSEFCYPNIIDFFGTTLCHICHFTKSDLFDYSAYNKYAESNIKQSDRMISDEVSQHLKNNDEIHHEDIISSYSREFQEFGDIYPAMHRKSMVIALYNFFEHQVKTMCTEINKLLPLDVSDKYLKEISIKRYRQFLRREAGFNLNQGSTLWELWEDMLKVEQIRHVLVHSEGEIENHRADRLAHIDGYCKIKKNIRLIRNRIIIDDGFVAALITDLITLFEQLDRQVSAFIRRYEIAHGSYEVPLPPGASRTPL